MATSSIFLGSVQLFTIIDKDTLEEYATDVTTSETYTHDSNVTSTVLQSGLNVSDHVEHSPNTIKIKGIVSDSPIEWSFPSFETISRSSEFYENLVALKESNTLLDIVTGLSSYENMILKTIVVERDKDKSKALFCDLTFVEFRIVEVSQTSIEESQVRDEQVPAASEEKNKGTVQSSSVENESLLSKITGWFS